MQILNRYMIMKQLGCTVHFALYIPRKTKNILIIYINFSVPIFFLSKAKFGNKSFLIKTIVETGYQQRYARYNHSCGCDEYRRRKRVIIFVIFQLYNTNRQSIV